MGKRGPKPMAKNVVVIRGLTLPAATLRRVAAHARAMPKSGTGKAATRMAALRDLIGRGLAAAEKEFG